MGEKLYSFDDSKTYCEEKQSDNSELYMCKGFMIFIDFHNRLTFFYIQKR
jgi:hypothetical protein